MPTHTSAAGIPARAEGVQLLGEVPGSGYRSAPSLVRRADGQVLQLTPLVYLTLREVDGRRTPEQVAAEVSEASGRGVSADNVARFIDQTLRPLGLLKRADGSAPEVRRANPLLALRFRAVVSNPALTRRITAPFAWLFKPVVVAVTLAAFAWVCWWVMFDKGLASATHEAFYSPGLLLAVFAITVLSAGFHEFGHAAAARYGGATPGAMGMGLYLVWPAFYTDVTDSYRLGRAGRVRTDLGGLYFNAIVAVAMCGAWWVTGAESLLLIIATQVLQMLRQLAPLVRFDGYHVLADVTGVPDLYHHIKPTLLGLLPHNWGRPEHKVLKPWARAVVSLWVLTVVPLLLGSLLLMVLAFPRVAATAGDSLAQQWHGFEHAFSDGDVPMMLAKLLALVAVALPVFGTAYLVTRLVRRIARQVWTRTAGKPGQRGVVVVLALALVAGLVWAWWPDGDSYRPIHSYERGAVQDTALLSGLERPGLQAGRITRARAAWPVDEPLPTADEPQLSVVLVPHDAAASDGTTATTTTADPAEPAQPGAWVFPFDRPPAPGEGDNQALAVNTTDGSVVYDVAFALVWADGGTTDNVNSAYALASCTRCAAVAVAFQVVLVVGQTDTVVPQNLSAAVNYNCLSCVTYALAQQLVVTVDRPLSDGAMSDLQDLWRTIAAYGKHLRDVPLSRIQHDLDSFKKQIQAIVQRDLGTAASPGTPTTSSTPSPTASATTSASPSASPSTTDTATPTETPTPTSGFASGASPTASPDEPSSSTSPSATGSSTPTPSTSPTASATSSSPSPTPSPTPTPTASPTGSTATSSTTAP